MPAFFSVLPYVLTMMAWCTNAKSIMGGTLTVLISFGVMAFISSLISNYGNKRQEKLYKLWGAAPSTLILRHSNQVLSKYTKARYYKWINNHIADFKMPSLEEEKNDPDDADQKYSSACDYLREFTRDKKKFSKIYRDLVAYGFARNLLSIQKFGLFIAVLSAIINAYFILPFVQGEGVNIIGPASINLYGIGTGIVSIIFLFAFLFIVNEDFVKERAFRYAKSLYETCETN